MAAMSASETEEKIPLDSVTQVLRLSKLKIKAILAGIDAPQPHDTITKDVLNHLILADLLDNLKFLSAEARVVILNDLWATKLNPPEDTPCCTGDQIFFADSRYCTWVGRAGWLDLETGEAVEVIPQEPVETIAYNLIPMRRMARAAIDTRSGKNAKQNAGSVEES
jgi:hypothetical protein